MVLGLTLVVAAATQFRRAGTPIHAFEQPTTLVTHGLYRYSRNPIYLGMIVLLTGVAVLLGSLSPFAAIPLFAVTIARRFIVSEESRLSAAFGDAYRQYLARTRRWL
jgi:protein-S-isoprenylcysteine O-methyltransferase Ste14